MKLRQFKSYLIIPITLLLACTNNNSKDPESNHVESSPETEAPSFHQFFDEVPAYEFPVKMSCNFERPAFNLDFEKYNSYFPEGGRVVSKLESKTQFPLIIFDFACDYSCPILYSFNEAGKRIDSVFLTPGQCGEDQFMTSNEWFIITEDIFIQLIDTTYHFIDSLGLQVLDSTTIEKTNYQLNNKGRFEIVRE